MNDFFHLDFGLQTKIENTIQNEINIDNNNSGSPINPFIAICNRFCGNFDDRIDENDLNKISNSVAITSQSNKINHLFCLDQY